MSSATSFLYQEYLARLDRDYVDGEIQERNLGERPHTYVTETISCFPLQRKASGEYGF